MEIDADDRGGTRTRPTEEETFAAAVDLVTRGSGKFKRFARRYSLCSADAEDAYQRSLEILLRKAPTADRAELRAWLHTVIKHEALALRRQRERALAGTGDEPADPAAEAAPGLDEQASGRERVRQTAEALTHLKPSEMQCLLLKALGYSYDEIAARTGYSWTKVNRSLTEGRRSFLERFGELASGEHCRGFEALLSTACDGEASDHEQRTLRAHLDRCGSCRAALRSYRAAPRRLAELFPPGLLGLSQQQGWWSRMGDWLSVNAGDRAGGIAWKLQQSAEALSAQKAAAVVASTAALAGGAAVHEHRPHRDTRPHRSARAQPVAEASTAAAVPVPASTPVPAAPPAAQPQTPSPVSAGGANAVAAQEFAPAPASTEQPRATAAAAGGEFGGPGAGGGAGGGGEFGP